MNSQEHLELLATAKAGHCALMLVAESGETNAFLVLRGAIKAFVSAAVSLDYEQSRTLLREIELAHFRPAHGVRLHLAVSNEAKEVKFV